MRGGIFEKASGYQPFPGNRPVILLRKEELQPPCAGFAAPGAGRNRFQLKLLCYNKISVAVVVCLHNADPKTGGET
jgi:hypothetical protein